MYKKYPVLLRQYAAEISAKQFPYFCHVTGELAESLPHLIRITIIDYLRNGFVHRWVRTCKWQQ